MSNYPLIQECLEILIHSEIELHLRFRDNKKPRLISLGPEQRRSQTDEYLLLRAKQYDDGILLTLAPTSYEILEFTFNRCGKQVERKVESISYTTKNVTLRLEGSYLYELYFHPTSLKEGIIIPFEDYLGLKNLHN